VPWGFCNDRETKDIDQFVLRIVAEGNFDPSASIEENISSLDFAKEVRDEALRLLEAVGT
jgi:hypothetical protein